MVRARFGVHPALSQPMLRVARHAGSDGGGRDGRGYPGAAPTGPSSAVPMPAACAAGESLPVTWRDGENGSGRISPGRWIARARAVESHRGGGARGGDLFEWREAGSFARPLHRRRDGRNGCWHRQFWATGRTLCHPTSANAAPTPSSDGRRIFAFYSSNDLVCLDLHGNLKWYRGLAFDYPHAGNDAGMASSPLVIGKTVVVQMENQGDSFAAGIDVETGRNRWRLARERDASWASPTPLIDAGRARHSGLAAISIGADGRRPSQWHAVSGNWTQPVKGFRRRWLPTGSSMFPRTGSRRSNPPGTGRGETGGPLAAESAQSRVRQSDHLSRECLHHQ